MSPRKTRTRLWRTRATRALDSPVMGKRKSGAPLAVRSNTRPHVQERHDGGEGYEALGGQAQDDRRSSYDPENLDGATIGRVSKQRRR